MINQLHYKNYTGSVFFSEEDGVFYGKIEGISDSVSFEGESVKMLTQDFHDAVDDYLEYCGMVKKEPEKQSFFNIRISPELHNTATIYANQKGLPLNVFVEETLKSIFNQKI